MKIDQEYLKGLLEAFEAAPEPITDIQQIKGAGFDYEDDRFLFHMQILNDQGLVAREDGEPGVGALRGADFHLSWAVLPLRLTAGGHAFLEALRNKEVWQVIKTKFKDGSIKTLVDVAGKLLEGYTTKKIQEILGTPTR